MKSKVICTYDAHLVTSMRPISRPILMSICALTLVAYNPMLAVGYSQRVFGSQLNLSADPSAAVIKVGDKATINLTVTESPATSSTVCFSQQGFPSSGFTLTFLPQCAPAPLGVASAQLVVEATPAAAPQNFTAVIVAVLGNQTASTPLTITVVPAIPAWIPWLGILLFFLVIGAALFVRPRKPKSKGKRKNE